MEMMLQQLLEDMRNMKGKLEEVDRRVRTQEIAKQPLEIFNPSGQNDEGSSKTPLDATPSHLIVQDTLSPNVTLPTKAHNQMTLPKGGGQQANLPPQVIRPQMRAQHNLEEHDSFDGDNYGYEIDDQAQQERLGGRGRRGGNGGWHPVDGREYNRRNDDEDRGFNNIKVTLPFFKGSSDPNEYLYWIVKLERQYNLNNVSDVKKMNYAISHLEGFASTWWEKIEKDALVNRNFVTNWNDMKIRMRERFVGQNYEQDTLKKYYNLQQGSKSVEGYYEELEHTRLRANVNDGEMNLVARFISGLNKEIRQPLDLHRLPTLYEAYQMALKVEGHQKENKSRVQSSSSSWAKNKEVWKSSPNWDNSKGAKQDFKSNFDKTKPKMDYKDLGYEHKANKCPNRRTIIALNDDGYQTEDESKDDHREDDSSDEFMGEGDGEEINDDGKLVLVVRRSMSALVREDLDQRENFGSCANVASVSMVEQLKLPTRRHPKPYRLQWLNECGELKVTKKVLIKFKIGSYHDEVLCDIVPMQACHLLLGRPWEYDVGWERNIEKWES
ncbi:hypothetical protein KY290_034100 [Solanum tuberosum]|uniref:Retrotransposon gag domain-containing protein n=1 Tax=Solanum tuberosum TaxID=4113 RepID=A0ABQ7U2B5_SOLTU|nr:hypothetical protein KY289_033492 [Solanum tuberosum]KAH0741057.1 hypothetical protein KY290_034100 [Solanum tuberosum]